VNEAIQKLRVSAFKIPTDFPESDGTLKWNSTTLILVELSVGGISGLGYTYAHEGCAAFIRQTLFPLIHRKNPFCLPALLIEMNTGVRNFGRNGIPSSAIAAVETALWDLKARLLGMSMVAMLGIAREKIPVYGSGGFTSYSDQQLRGQFEHWAAEGISMMKMKVGREPERDKTRVQSARNAIGDKVKLFVDANGAYSPKQALRAGETFSEQKVSWFEEPVSSDDTEGLRFVRDHVRPEVEVAAGEYNYDIFQARRMLETRAVDVLQADATRCGISGFMQMAALCDAFQVPLSAHTAPALHAHLCCCANRAIHVEYFHDHVRIEQLFFEGATTKHKNGFLSPDLSQPGLGLDFKRKNTAKFLIDI
jgi:L-alanine-DL-glutamate epimerase-like enolase superfamily enzyme